MALLLLGGCARAEHRKALDQLERELALGIDRTTRRSLSAFESPEALSDYLTTLERAREARQAAAESAGSDAVAFSDGDGVAVYDFADDSIDGEMLSPQGAMVSRSAGNRSVTNTQEAAVDEGGIVKMIGDHLVVLRRGRLFSVDVSGRGRARRSRESESGLGQDEPDRRARPVDAIDVSPERGHFAWYDELLVTGNTALVVGYSYDNEGTELLRFRLDGQGRWHRLDGWVMRSSDYYSSRNYASRLVGDRLVMYTQSWLRVQRGKVGLPAVARWDGGRIRRADWSEVMEATDIHRPVLATEYPVLHVVIDCDLLATPLRCRAQGMLGPSSRSFYFSGDAVYVWLHAPEQAEGAEPDALVHRLPFDGSPAGALRTWGVPIDQFSFKERDGVLAVLVSLRGRGDGMWGAEHPKGAPLALMRVPVAEFHGVADVQRDALLPLGRPGAERWSLVDRFVGDHLLFGAGAPWAGPEAHVGSTLHAVRYVDSNPQVRTLDLPHAVDRIEVLGSHAMIVGGRRDDLVFTSVELGPEPRRAAQHVVPGAAQGETRSHGFFFSPRGPRDGVLGLPIRPGHRPGWAHLVDDAAGVMFLNVDDLRLSALGTLHGDRRQAEVDDRCDNSCVDWYGSARPLFIDDRVFALLGYQLVEGRVNRGRIEALDHTNLLQVVDGVVVPGTS